MVGVLGIPHRDVAGDTLAESQPTEDPQRAGQLVPPVVALFLDRGERRGSVTATCWRRQFDAVDHRGGSSGALVGTLVSVMAMSFTLLPVHARA